MRRKLIDEDGVRERLGVSPASVPDFLALVGDSADGIPGIARWGQKSASIVLTRYEHLEQIPSDPDEWEVKVRGATALSENLEANRSAALLYRQLATLRTDVPLAEGLPDLLWSGPGEDLAPLCEELGARVDELDLP
jgi:5'-3' exonuclease